jgi:hypothetical protein
MCSVLQRNHAPQTMTACEDGVSTYLALTFGTLLSSQGTEASFGTVSPAPPGFPFFVSPTLAEAIWSELPTPFRAHTFPRVSSRRLCQRTGLPRVEQIDGRSSGRGGSGLRR